MPLETRLICSFEHQHEMLMWEKLCSDLTARLQGREGLSILIGNLECRRLIDALFITRRGICVLEFKSHSGVLVAEPNAAWTIDGREIVAGGDLNPMRQVREMRFAVQNRLEAWWAINRPDIPQPDWRRSFNARVVFNDPLVVEDFLDETTHRWFGIKPLSEIAASLGRLRCTGFDVDDSVVEALAMEVRRVPSAGSHRRADRGPRGQVPVNPVSTDGSHEVPRIFYCESEKQFNNSRRALVQRQGDAQIARGVIESILRQIRQGRNPLRDIPFVGRTEVHGLRVHKVSADHLLLVIHIDGKNYLVIVGSEAEVEDWIAVNAGATFAVDIGNARLTRTQVDVPQTDAETVMTTDNKPFIERVADDIVRAEIPDEYLEKVSSIDEDTSPEDREEALAEIQDPDLRLMLGDVLELARTGRLDAAKARVKLYSGDAVPLQDAPELHEAALESIENSDELVDLASTDESDFLKIMDSVEDERWMWFLHPGQERVVVENFPNPCVLTGVSGSGKTSVLLHRARRLAAKHQNQEILVLTLNESLARMIHSNLVRFCSPDEASRIKSLSFHGYLRKLLRKTDAKEFLQDFGEQTHQSEAIEALLGGEERDSLDEIFEALEPRELKELFNDFCLQLKGKSRDDFNNLEVFLYNQAPNIDPSEYLFDEMELLRSAFPCKGEYDGYLGEFPRQGRAIPFQRNRKEQVLRLLWQWEAYQITRSFLDHMGLVQAAFIAMERLGGVPDDLRFRCVLVDEFQDFSNLEIKIISAIPTHTENGLFLTGDYAQKLYARQLNLNEAGLYPRTNRRILKNYRNTRQILTAAQGLIEAYPMPVDRNAADGVELLKPDYAAKEGSKPTAYQARDTILAAWRDVVDAVNTGLASQSLCIISADTEHYPLDEIISCRPSGLDAQDIADWGKDEASGVVVSDINSVKGFEFRRIYIVGMEDGSYPPKGHYVDEHWRDAQRLYVAITRGRDEVRFYYEGEPSAFLKAMDGTINFAKDQSPQHDKVAKIITDSDFQQSLTEQDPQYTCDEEITEHTKLSPFLIKQRERLLDLKETLLDSMSHSYFTKSNPRKDNSVDAGIDSYDRDFALSMLSKEQGSLYEIDEALKRIKDGSYGVCELCEKPIKHARLEVLPFTRYTLDCQAELEKRQHHCSVRPHFNSLGQVEEKVETKGPFYNYSYINGQKLLVFFRRPNQLELAEATRVSAAHIQNMLMHMFRLGLVPHSLLEKHLVIGLCREMGYAVEFMDESVKIQPMQDIAPISECVEENKIEVSEVNIIEEKTAIPESGFEIGEIRIMPLIERRRELKYLFNGVPEYAEISVYPIKGLDSLELDIHLLEFENGERQITCGRNLTGKRVWERLVYRLRKGIDCFDEDAKERVLFMDLRQARFTKGEWSSRFVVEKDSLDEGAGLNVFTTLFDAGALDCGTKQQVLGEINRTRGWLCVSFSANNEKVPLAAYVLTTILPLIKGMVR